MTQLDRNFTDGMADYFAREAKATAEFDSQSSATNCHGADRADAELLIRNPTGDDMRQAALRAAANWLMLQSFR